MKAIVVAVVVFLLFACRKSGPEFNGVDCPGNCYILTGKVVDTPSNSGLAGVELKIYYRPPGLALFSDPTRYLGKTTTTANGAYKFQFDGTKYRNGAGYFRIEARKPGYFYHPNAQNDVAVFNLDSTQFNQPYEQNFALFRPAKMTVRFKASTVTNFEFLTYSYHYGTSGMGISLNGRRQIDTTITFQTAGDVRTFVNWSAIGNGVNIRKNDTLFTTRGGTINYRIDL